MKLTDEHKRKIGEAKKGVASWNKGIPQSSEAKEKNRQAHLHKYEGKKNPMFGKHHLGETRMRCGVQNLGRKMSKEVREKMSLAHKGKNPREWGAGFPKGGRPWNKGSEIRAYFAGLVDGEGSIFVTKNYSKKEGVINDRYKRIVVAIAMRADKAICLYEAQKIWGGNLYIRPPRKSNHHEVLDWKLSMRGSERFLKQISPFLRIKKRQVEIALEFRKLQTRKRIGTNHILDEEMEYRKKLEQELKQLNS